VLENWKQILGGLEGDKKKMLIRGVVKWKTMVCGFCEVEILGQGGLVSRKKERSKGLTDLGIIRGLGTIY